jgi:hypothetical protein
MLNSKNRSESRAFTGKMCIHHRHSR